MTFGRWPLPVILLIVCLAVACGDNREPESNEPAIRADIAALRNEVATLREKGALQPRAALTPVAAPPPEVSREDIRRLEAEIARVAEESDTARTLLRAHAENRATPAGLPLDSSAFTLQLLHAADMDGTTGALENVENFSAILDGFRAQFPNNTLVLSSGDNYVPGPRYYAAADPANASTLGVPGNGRSDIALLNAMGFQASALGNHELDHGTGTFAGIIGSEIENGGTYPGALFPYLSSNLDFTDDENLAGLVVDDGQEAMLVGASLARSAVVTVNGERIGIVGATTPFLPAIADTGGVSVMPVDSDDLAQLTEIIQGSVDGLVSQGINKIILLAHMQRLDIEQELATRLENVDIIVAGGSNTLLADETDRLWPGDEAVDTYPLVYRSATGEATLLVNTDGDYRYLGRLVVRFDEQGRVIPESVDPHLSGAYATHPQGGQAFAGRPIPEVLRITESLRDVLAARDGNIVGKTAVYLAGARADVRTQETNLGNLTADANLWLARQVDSEVRISLKNGGGIRGHIGVVWQPPGTNDSAAVEYLPPSASAISGKPDGGVSQFDVEGTLRFNNGLVIAPLTAQQLVNILEHAVGFDGVGTVTDGRFPQVGGLRFSFDPSHPVGQRIRSLAVVDDDGAVEDVVVRNGAPVGAPGRIFKIVTLNFLANGGDGYPFPVPHAGRMDLAGEAGQFNAPDPEFPDTNGNGAIDEPNTADPGLAGFAAPGTEQDALAEYLAHFFRDIPFDRSETPPLGDHRIQNLGVPGKTDTVLDE